MKSGNTGLRRILVAATCSAKGFKYAWQNEAAFRQELMCYLILVPIGFWLGNGAVEKSLLVGTCLAVLTIEILNSAVEAVVDRIGAELHVLSGAAKDMASAAVLLGWILTLLVWGLIGYEHWMAS